MSEYEELKARIFNKKECGWENLREEEKTNGWDHNTAEKS